MSTFCQRYFVRDILSAIDCNATIKSKSINLATNIKGEEVTKTVETSKKFKLRGMLQTFEMKKHDDMTMLFDDLKRFDIEQLKSFDANNLRPAQRIQILEEQINLHSK